MRAPDEISQLMYLRPDLIDMEARVLEDQAGSGGRLALAADADQATAERGRAIMEACLDSLCREVDGIKAELGGGALSSGGLRDGRGNLGRCMAFRSGLDDGSALAGPGGGHAAVAVETLRTPRARRA
ncbi:hypothetical protein OMP38_13860 [Cohnella ginsengisoli]|uniref:Uncharacterized protein n=1 Tax=Cohnella ginsengisoli TaxID=425004 RepID=A0A9X4QMD7_9BACL|nr:hypothetical protein [Cohnella ginsengisoli]MDG0791824.1 hypothetical protein [Cohnella ginsengisoli]